MKVFVLLENGVDDTGPSRVIGVYTSRDVAEKAKESDKGTLKYIYTMRKIVEKELTE